MYGPSGSDLIGCGVFLLVAGTILGACVASLVYALLS